MLYYAHEGADGVAYALTATHSQLAAGNVVALPGYDTSVLGRRRVGAQWLDVDPPPEPEPEPTPDPRPAAIDEAALIDLCQSAGAMSDEQLVAADADPALRVFWIKLRAASALLPTDPRVQDGLAAVEALGYLPAGSSAVLAAWPTN